MSNLYKQFRKAKSETKRCKVIAEWVHTTMGRLPAVRNVLDHEKTKLYMYNALEDSARFTGRKIDGNWALHPEWFQNLIAQGTDNVKIRQFFELLDWDYDYFKNPSYTECTSQIDVGIPGRPCMITVISKGHFPEGTLWKNRKSGKRWKILCDDIGDGNVEFEPYGEDNKSKVNMIRSAGNINKFMKRVDG